MATFVVTGQEATGGTTTIDATDKLGFFGTSWDDGITVTEYQTSTHVETSVPADKCTNHLHNTKYISGTQVDLDGGGTVLLTTLGDGDVPLKINFSHGSLVETLNAEFFAYDGGSPDTDPPASMTVQVVEAGNTPWVATTGSGTALSVDDHSTPATSHDYFFGISVSPTAGGELTELTFQFLLYYQ